MRFSKIFSVLMMLVASGCYTLANPQVFTQSKKVNKAFRPAALATIEITNKYGKVIVTESDNDSLYINISMTVQSDNQEKVEKMASSIDFDFTATNHFIIAQTVIGKKQIGIVEQLLSLTDMFELPENYVEINYEVIAPPKAKLVINNKYGDIFIGNHLGKLDISLSNGDLKAYQLKGETSLDLKFGDAVITEVNDANIALSYASIDLKKGNKISFDSKSSEISIDKCKDINLISKRDKATINEVNTFIGNTYFTDITIQEIEHLATIDAKYGNITFEKIYKDFSDIRINSKYSNIHLFFEQGSAYQLMLNCKNVDISYPSNVGSLSEKVYDEQSKFYTSSGQFGSGQHSSEVSLNAEYGNISIIHR